MAVGPSSGVYGRDAILAARKKQKTPTTPSVQPTPKPPTIQTSTSGSNKSGKGSSGSNKVNPPAPNPVQTIYTDPSGKQQTGYIINGKTYKDPAGTQRIDIGSKVDVGGKTYIMTESGGKEYAPPQTQGSLGGSKKAGSSAPSPKATPTTYIDPYGKEQQGYIIGGKTYKDPAGKTRIDVGSTVTVGGKTYKMTESGGVEVPKPQVAPIQQQPTSAPKQITYTDPSGNTQTGYLIDGKTFKDPAGTQRIETGSEVTVGNKKYLLANNGMGLDITNAQEAYAYALDENGQIDESRPIAKLYNIAGTNYDAATGQKYRNIAGDNVVIKNSNGKYYMARTGEEVSASAIGATVAPSMQGIISSTQDVLGSLLELYNQKIAMDPTLTREQALALAIQQLNPQYKSAIESAMEQLDINAIRSGFYGQLPVEAIKAQTAGALEASKIQAINELAAQLFGESEEAAYNKLESQRSEQQSKIANLLSLLGLLQDQQAYADSKEDSEFEKAYKEALLTGNYKGQKTLDFLQEQRLASGGGSGSGKLTPSIINSMYASGLISKPVADSLLASIGVNVGVTGNNLTDTGMSAEDQERFNRYRTAMGRLATNEERVKYLQNNQAYIEPEMQKRLLEVFGLS